MYTIWDTFLMQPQGINEQIINSDMQIKLAEQASLNIQYQRLIKQLQGDPDAENRNRLPLIFIPLVASLGLSASVPVTERPGCRREDDRETKRFQGVSKSHGRRCRSPWRGTPLEARPGVGSLTRAAGSRGDGR